MKKKYLVSNDQYSGQVVIVCETEEVEVNTYKPTEEQLLEAMYLYTELPKKMEKKTHYMVKIYYHYELGENAFIPDGEGCTNLLEFWQTFDKDKANEYFKMAIAYCR